MKWNKALKIINVVFPVIGIGLMIAYGVCDTSCSSLQGTFLGVDLKLVGILYMAVLFVLTLPPASRYATTVNHLRTMMLAGALGGEVLLVRFQIVHDIYCPFCLAFGFCLAVLFAANFMQMNKYLALSAFLAGVTAFVLFFKGSVLPLYTLRQSPYFSSGLVVSINFLPSDYRASSRTRGRTARTNRLS